MLSPIPNRMPAMLSKDDAQKWLAVDDEIAHALSLLEAQTRDAMEGDELSSAPTIPATIRQLHPAVQLHRRTTRLIAFSDAFSTGQ